MKSYSMKLRWSDGSGSDLFAIYKAYKVNCIIYSTNFILS